MLAELSVQNFALIENIHLSFGPHLNVLTGETGSGKSIIVDAMMLLLGDRANVRDIRLGEDSALIEGVFELQDGSPLHSMLADMGFESNPLVLSRELRQSGKNTCRINHRQVTLSQFRALSRQLVTIYGQHDYQVLMDSAQQLDMLDALGDDDHQTLLARVEGTYHDAQKVGRQLKRVLKESRQEEAEREALQEKLDFLEPLNLQKGEETEVEAAFQRAVHAQELQERLARGYGLLDGQEDSLRESLIHVQGEVKRAAELDDRLKPLLPELDNVRIVLEEVAHTLAQRLEAFETEMDVERLSDRLAVFDRVRRRFGKSIDALIDEMALWQNKLAQGVERQAEIPLLRTRYQEAKRRYKNACDALRASRKCIAERLTELLLQALADLSMPHARFQVAFDESAGNAKGMDEVQFLLAANPGSAPAPLQEVASGGEMSRIMLAFKTILNDSRGRETLIFDEIDTGIGGITLNQVATKLSLVSRHEQVICVTHAAPIAALSDHHFYIYKETDGETTRTFVQALDESATVRELARMIGGAGEWQLNHAAELRRHHTRLRDQLFLEGK